MSDETVGGNWVPDSSHKVPPPPEYPPEEGRFLRGNDLSPVAVCVILKWPEDKIPPDIEKLVRVGVESGSALSGTLQTENIGTEKMICNLAANPNIRWLVICGPESPGHATGQALQALWANGVADDSRIIGAEAPTPFLHSIPRAASKRVRQQIRLVDLLNEGRAEVVRDAVWSCYQEQPTPFQDYGLFDPGAYCDDPICSTITWRVPPGMPRRHLSSRLQ
ncbi:MAG: tetrahydromethanopterin S-methyltransferase subunit A [Armatimonadetes bacterium]|nr:tetrahydromethanopterin S-methyltransferase subunit A [Armatimonadota bacterium]